LEVDAAVETEDKKALHTLHQEYAEAKSVVEQLKSENAELRAKLAERDDATKVTHHEQASEKTEKKMTMDVTEDGAVTRHHKPVRPVTAK